MNAETDIQVWLETFARSQPSIIVPYVKASQEKTLNYSVSTVSTGHGGRSATAQSGTVYAPANTAVALSRFAIKRSPEDNCRISILLSEPNLPAKKYQFNCPE